MLVRKNRKTLEYISGAYLKGALSHAYILEGRGKEEFAGQLSMALMCSRAQVSEDGIISGCGRCPLYGDHVRNA